MPTLKFFTEVKFPPASKLSYPKCPSAAVQSTSGSDVAKTLSYLMDAEWSGD